MPPSETDSVYYAKALKSHPVSSAGARILGLQGNPDVGVHAARNLLKALNHLDVVKKKEAIASQLNLNNLTGGPAEFAANYAVVEAFHRHAISEEEAIYRLCQQLATQGAPVAAPRLREMVCSYSTIRHMEFHPCDTCNLACRGCTYGYARRTQRTPVAVYPYERLPAIRKLNPLSIVIVGGGEPTLYRECTHTFEDLVARIRELLPSTRLALITNGTYKPTGTWPGTFDWIRLSLDAASGSTYASFRGKDCFAKVLNNFLEYLQTPAKKVGIGFLFARSNVHEYASVAKLVYNLVVDRHPDLLPKVDIHYRPLRRNPIDYGTRFEDAVTDQQIESTTEQVLALAQESSGMADFLQNQTNVSAILGGNIHPPHEFARCYYSEVFKIVRANGDLMPCFVRVAEDEFALGNVICDSTEAIGLHTLCIATAQRPHCDQHGCRQCHVNYILERGLAGGLSASKSQLVRDDPMF